MLWDGFLCEPEARHEAMRMEVIRQIERLLLECSVLWITTASNERFRWDWDRFVTHRIRLEDGLATVCGSQIPYQVSMAGILS